MHGVVGDDRHRLPVLAVDPQDVELWIDRAVGPDDTLCLLRRIEDNAPVRHTEAAVEGDAILVLLAEPEGSRAEVRVCPDDGVGDHLRQFDQIRLVDGDLLIRMGLRARVGVRRRNHDIARRNSRGCGRQFPRLFDLPPHDAQDVTHDDGNLSCTVVENQRLGEQVIVDPGGHSVVEVAAE